MFFIQKFVLFYFIVTTYYFYSFTKCDNIYSNLLKNSYFHNIFENNFLQLTDNKNHIYSVDKSENGSIIKIEGNESIKIILSDIDEKYSDFLVVQVHSQIYDINLIYKVNDTIFQNESGTNPALVIILSKNNKFKANIIIENQNEKELSVLLLVRNYTNKEPIPGGLLKDKHKERFPRPYLLVEQNLLDTWISFSLSIIPYSKSSPSLKCINEFCVKELNANLTSYDQEKYGNITHKDFNIHVDPALTIKYKIYLSYVYEGDLRQEPFWDAILQTSTVEGIKQYSHKVLEISPSSPDDLHLIFVSYSGVGAVVNVVASFNGSNGVLYSSAFFYGCNFIPGEEYKCTKLATSFERFICACFLFMGLVLLFVGHRWLNMTMFISGFLASWFLLFVIFINVHDPDMDVLGICTLIGAIVGGTLWLVIWHKMHRPFFSALLLILLSAFFAAMVSTHFLKYALVPSRNNLAAFIVFPIAFSLLIVSYSIFDIKKVHILSCTLLGSYLSIVPFAFYFGSSLTYIVINVVSVMMVPKFSEAIGYPPFQACDITLLCAWITLFLFGTAYQFYREYSSPPFHPPNTASFDALIEMYNWVIERIALLIFRNETACCHLSTCCYPRHNNDRLINDDLEENSESAPESSSQVNCLD